jgi:hypothetical protein
MITGPGVVLRNSKGMNRHITQLARKLGICAIVCGLISGCGDRSGPVSPPPTAPSPSPPVPAPPVPEGTFTVSGVVSEAVGGVLVPLEAVHVEDSNRHYSVNTASDGSYTVRDVAAGTAYFYIAKQGFRPETRQFTLTGDMRLDIRLIRQ